MVRFDCSVNGSKLPNLSYANMENLVLFFMKCKAYLPDLADRKSTSNGMPP